MMSCEVGLKTAFLFFAIYKIEGDDGSASSVRNIVNFEINTYSISVYYINGSREEYFKYNSDGTFSESVEM